LSAKLASNSGADWALCGAPAIKDEKGIDGYDTANLVSRFSSHLAVLTAQDAHEQLIFQ
jgi:hypothetical protein